MPTYTPPEVPQAARVCPWASCLVSVVAVAKDSERVNTDGRPSLAGAMSACLSNTRLHMPTSGARGCKLSPAVGATTWNSP
jgi:hypothetical protein